LATNYRQMNNTPKQISFITSIFLSLIVVSVCLLLLKLEVNKNSIIFLLIIFIVVLICSFWIYRISLEKFILSRVKIIYKIIRKNKIIKNSENAITKIDFSKDLIREASDEVAQWADDQSVEIEQLKKMEQYRKEFLGNVSHELKTPLFSIQGYISTLLDGGLEDRTINRLYLERTERNIDRLILIIKDLESISRLEYGELKLEISTFNIVQLTKDVFEAIEIKAKQKNIMLLFGEIYDKPVMVSADKERIRQVVTNIVNNSVSYGNENGKTKVSFFDMEDHILVEITDNGIGIEEKDLKRIFERFYRCDKARSRDHGGTGLGLSIVKHILDAHDETINVRSTIGVGTTFAFTLNKS